MLEKIKLFDNISKIVKLFYEEKHIDFNIKTYNYTF